MVKRDEIEAKMKSYIEENKLSAFEALYMWSKGINSTTIAGILHNKYNSVEGFDIITTDLNNFEIRGPSQNVELTNEEVGVVIRDVFSKHQQPLLDSITEKLALLRYSEKAILLALIRSTLFEKEKVSVDEINIAYGALYGETIKERFLMEIISYLENRGIIYCERVSYGRPKNILIPEYIYTIQDQIETKLPKVIITEEKEDT